MALDKIVIIGAGHAGGRLALELRANAFDGYITLVGEEPELPYERPPLSKGMVTGEEDFTSSRLGNADFWKEQNIVFNLGNPAIEVMPSSNQVKLADGEILDYDQLVFANGAGVRRLPIFDAPELPATYLRTLEDARWVKNKLSGDSSVLIVGAGVIGLEIAASIVKLGGKAHIVEAGLNVMGRAVSPVVAKELLDMHIQQGVNFHFDTIVQDVVFNGDGLAVTLKNGYELEFDFAIIGIGVIPNDGMAAKAGVAVDDGILVDAQGRTNISNIWAIGDVAKFPMAGRQVRQETWRHADNHPRIVAKAILGGDDVYDEVPGFWSDQFDIRLQVEGVLEGEEIIRKNAEGQLDAVFYTKNDYLVGAASLRNPKLIALARRTIAKGQKVVLSQLTDSRLKPKQALSPP